MQHTGTYNLNLIETSDTFSPAPLNENTQKLENIIAAGASAEAQARADADAALDGRVTALEGHKVAVGTYTGTAGDNDPTTQFIPLPFTPRVVFVQANAGISALALPTITTGNGVYIKDGGFQVSDHLNRKSVKAYPYLAICW